MHICTVSNVSTSHFDLSVTESAHTRFKYFYVLEQFV